MSLPISRETQGLYPQFNILCDGCEKIATTSFTGMLSIVFIFLLDESGATMLPAAYEFTDRRC